MIFALSTILLFIITSENVLFWVYLWQLKEYRLDRLTVHIKDTQQGRNIFFSLQPLVVFLAFFLGFVSIFVEAVAFYYSLITLFLLGFLAVRIILIFFNKQLKRPVLTTKAMGVVALSFFFIFSFFLFPLTDKFIWLFIVIFLTPLLVALSVFLFAFPTEIVTDIYIQKARKKRNHLKHLTVIAVSGSYGKSSTKEIIAHILAQQFTVVKTTLSNNTPIAVAKTILQKVNENTDFFVVELGAYKKGEIKQLAEMVGPTISVTTAVSDQHLALYGDSNDVITSELELIRVIPRNGLILLNGNSKGVVEMAKKIKRPHIIWYTTQNAKKQKDTVSAVDIVAGTKGVKFMYTDAKTTIDFSSPLLGIHTIENILPGIFLANYFAIPLPTIQKAIHTLNAMPKTMEEKKVIPGITIIDDTFNASPESVAAAISYLNLSSKRKILVMSPLIELGKNSKLRHREIGEKAAGIDILLLTNKNNLAEIQEGIENMKAKTHIIVGSYTYLAEKLRSLMQKGDTIVFEGKEAGIVLQKLL